MLGSSEDNGEVIYEKKYAETIFNSPWWHIFYKTRDDVYTLKHVPSGTKGDLLPIFKNDIPLGVFAASNISIAGKRKFSLYSNSPENLEEMLILYVVEFIDKFDYLDIDSLTIKFSLLYTFTGRKALTPKHIEMLPNSAVPHKFEAIIWLLISICIVTLAAFVSLKIILLVSALMLGYQVFIMAGNIYRGLE